MYDEPEEMPEERAAEPAKRAEEKANEFRMHAEIYAVFEAVRKFDAGLDAALDDGLAREVQKRIGKLEKSKDPESPILPPDAAADAGALFAALKEKVSANDYHVRRRPGEAVIVRWIEGEQVETFYDRFQAHFDVAMTDYREEERQAQGWKKDAETLAYLNKLDELELKVADRYLRALIRQHNLFVLSTLSVDEMDILHLCDFVMGVPAADVVGRSDAPPEEDATERDRAWFFKLFSLRGIVDGVERMCWFTYLQKAEDTFDTSW
jgi:hypothetical protein